MSISGWFTTAHIWLLIGFFGQGMFFMRFVVQWIASEKSKQSVMPVAFWYFSVFGGAITLVYVIYRNDWPLIAGQATGLLIYSRNLWFIHGRPKRVTARDD
jgi:lipid-A-disaccharide synthase-like uncharacterized protein